MQNGRRTNWTSLVGIMYASDYIYTYALGVSDVCYNTPSACYSNNGTTPLAGWMSRSYSQWSMPPYLQYSSLVFIIGASNSSSGSGGNNVNGYHGVIPVVYLKPNIKIISGDGSEYKPYQLEL